MEQNSKAKLVLDSKQKSLTSNAIKQNRKTVNTTNRPQTSNE